MTVLISNIIPRKRAEAAQTTQYISTDKTIIDKFTATNTTGSAAVLSVFLPANGEAAAASNCVLSAKSIAAGDTYLCPELVGQVLETGGFISTVAGTASAITISASGRLIS